MEPKRAFFVFVERNQNPSLSRPGQTCPVAVQESRTCPVAVQEDKSFLKTTHNNPVLDEDEPTTDGEESSD